jgi:hypothetical protein
VVWGDRAPWWCGLYRRLALRGDRGLEADLKGIN